MNWGLPWRGGSGFWGGNYTKIMVYNFNNKSEKPAKEQIRINMYIGAVSQTTGASRKAIRLYEEMGLIEKPERNGNYRVYEDHHIHVINMIKRAQGVGFKLSELVALTDEKSDTDRFPVEMALNLINEKREELALTISQIQKTDADLVTLSEEVAQFYSD